jgi:predicted nuclease of predicted toxin-antitoxin system
MRSLLDHNVPLLLARILTGYDAVHASSRGWGELTNGRLLATAEAEGFDVLVTADQNIQHQQNLGRRHLALVVLSTNHWPTIQANPELVLAALAKVGPGQCIPVTFEKKVLRRRAFKPTGRSPS